MRLFVAGIRKLVRRPATYVTFGLLVGLLALIYIAVGATARQAASSSNGGRQALLLVTFPGAATDPRWAAALADLVRRGAERSVEVRKVDGQPVSGEIADVVRTAGFVDGYRGLVLRAA